MRERRAESRVGVDAIHDRRVRRNQLEPEKQRAKNGVSVMLRPKLRP
jgi:hypothetical protein